MPRVCNSEDAKVEVDAIRKERYLLIRLRELLIQERARLSGDVDYSRVHLALSNTSKS